MFIHNLNCEQQAVLLFLAHEVAKADGFLHEQQIEMIEILQQQPIDGVIEIEVAVADLPRIFDSEKAKSSALLELFIKNITS